MNRTEGIALLRQRVALSRERLRQQWSAPPPATAPVPYPWVVTGLGSSEAHARYLVALANADEPGAAVFLPTSAFARRNLPTDTADAALIVFSQGFSANAQIALAPGAGFRTRVLFTAATPEALRNRGKTLAAERLEALHASGDSVIPTAEADEFTILLRVIGPLCGYLSALQWIQAQRPGTVAELSAEEQVRLFAASAERPPSERRALAQDLARGVEFNFAGPESEYAQNLSYKRVEGLFLPEPVRRDLLQFVHGPFQQNRAAPRAQWIFAAADTAESTLAERLWPMFKRLDRIPRLIRSPLPAPYAIFHYEMLLNEALLPALEECPHSQFDWPGKGLDGEGYSLDEPV